MSSSAPFSNPLCVALDIEKVEDAISMAKALRGIVGGFKVGPRLINKAGEKIIHELANFAPVFVDCKYFDIPSTMIAAIRSAFDAGASVVTIHALSGAEALSACAKLESELNKVRPFKVLAVTILTSWKDSSYPPVFNTKDSLSNVLQLAHFVLANGLGSIVCSGEELSSLRQLRLFKLVPGIRRRGDQVGDQSRVITPRLALQSGANVIVVGRPIIEAKDPLLEAEKILQDLN